jgi:hypothetical protein
MSRPRLFDRPMTSAERVRRHRARKGSNEPTFDPAPTEADLRRWLILSKPAADGEGDAPQET